MESLKKNIKWIISVIILMVIVSGVSVYATSTYLASQVTYKDDKTVEQALNELYNKYKESNNLSMFSYNSISNTTSENRLIELNLEKGKYLLICNEYNANTPDPGTNITVTSDNEGVIINKKAEIKSTGSENASYGATSCVHIYTIETQNNCVVKIIGNDGRTRSDVAGGMNYIVLSNN